MSRYTGPDYRGPRDRSRSPPRFNDRRASAANIFDNRPPGPHRNGSDAPRGPRSQLDAPPARGPPPPSSLSGPGSGLGVSIPPPRALRDAPPLTSGGDRGRPFREREYDRRDRLPSPRERSPPRNFNLPPRDVETGRPRRLSREGPVSAGPTYVDSPFASAPFRGGFGRGRGRGDFDYRGGRAPRRPADDRERDLFRRSPPRYGRDLSRDSRDADRRDERRFDRRDDDRRPDWTDRDRELDRGRREALLPPNRADPRPPGDAAAASHAASAAPPINPDRLAILESTGADATLRRPSITPVPPLSRDSRRDIPPETPPYLNGRAETTANRYGSRGSSPPTQAPPVPAFSFSVAPTPTSMPSIQASKPAVDTKPSPTDDNPPESEAKPVPAEEKSVPQQPEAAPALPAPPQPPPQAVATAAAAVPPPNAPTAPKAPAPAPAPKAHLTSPLLSAPKAPRAHENENVVPITNRLQGVKSLEALSGSGQGPGPNPRPETSHQTPAIPSSPGSVRQNLTHLSQPISPNLPQGPRFGELAAAPTGPRATRASPAQSSVSPRPPFATSPRSDIGSFQPAATFPRAQTPPPTAPSGPRRQSFSVSPRATHSSVPSAAPTAPRGARVPPSAPRANPGVFSAQNRPPDRPANAPPPTAPSGPRGHQWNQWRRPGGMGYGDKPVPSIPAKRDFNGDERERAPHASLPFPDRRNSAIDESLDIDEHGQTRSQDGARRHSMDRHADRTDIDRDQANRKSTQADGHSAAQSFFGKQLDEPDDEIDSSSEDDELDEDEDATLLEAKHARKERELRSRMIELDSRECRATTPLESVARLARISIRDLQRVNERDLDMDIDDHAIGAPHLGAPVAQSSESDDGPDVLTPNGDDSQQIAIRDQDLVSDSRRRMWKRSPEVIALRYLEKPEDVSALQDNEMFQDNIKRLVTAEPDTMHALRDEVEAEEVLDDEAEADFEFLYRQWREDCEELDRQREEEDRLERQQSQEPGPEVDGPTLLPSNPIIEGRRIHKFSSEYEFKQVLKQSEETARIEQERLEREAKKVQADMEKEAWLPDQLPEEVVVQRTMIDANGFRKPETLTLVFSYEPPADNFTDSEQSIFIAAFKETPKKWGEIASLLPGRTYRDCIHHYYANKWDGRFRDNRAKKLKGGRRGRGGKSSRPTRGSALMADLNRSEDLLTAPNVSDSGRPKRAAAPTTFGEKDPEQKAAIMGTSPAKKSNQARHETNSETGSDGRAKRQKRTGDKPGRKPKNLTAIAAAPAAQSAPGVQIKEDQLRAQDLADASLLAGLSTMHPDGRGVFTSDVIMHQHAPVEEQERTKPVPTAKPSASSYWSGPEKTDFVKYIAHFGSDFAAIAAHMQTKTHIMIKNHFQRQTENGKGLDLVESARKADERRERGEDLGAPPTPTPIVKRKYDNPQTSTATATATTATTTTTTTTTTSRALTSQTEAMEVDDHNSSNLSAAAPKHASPPQYQSKPRFAPSSAASTPIQTPRIVPSPVPAAANPLSGAASASSHNQSLQGQHPLGSRSYFADSHVEPRPGIQQPSLLRAGVDVSVSSPARNQPLVAQPSHAQFIQGLEQEQDKAMRIQARHDRIHSRHTPLQHLTTHSHPGNQAIPMALDRKQPILEDKTPTPPRMPSASGSNLTYPLFGSSSSGPNLSSLTPRASFNPSPPKPDISRPASVMAVPLQTTPAPPPAPALEPPKRSNLLSLLNSDHEPEEQKPVPKHEPLPSGPSRTSSPAYGTSTSLGPSNLSQGRREPFAPPTGPYHHRPQYSQAPPTSAAPPPATLKHEPSSAGSSSATPNWASQVLGQREATSGMSPLAMDRSTQPFDRDPRPFYTHRGASSLLGPAPSRVNPSPPPHTINNHSRAPSFAGPAGSPLARDQRSVMNGMPQGPPHPMGQSLGPSQYGAPVQPSPYSQAPINAPNRAAHSHNNSLGDGMSVFRRAHNGSRGPDESVRREEEMARARHERERERERSGQDYPMSYAPMYTDRSADYQAQRRQEQEYERQRQETAPPPMPRPPPSMPPQSTQPPFNPAYSQSRHGFGPRDQSMREYESSAPDDRRFREQDSGRHYHEAQHPPGPPSHSYNRNDREPPLHGPPQPVDPFYPRRTPLGPPHYAPPPPHRR